MTSQSASALRSRYVQQAASDLEENRRLQKELAERIKMLKQEEALLSDIITLAGRYESLAERQEGFADSSRLPEQVTHERPAEPANREAAAPSVKPASHRPASGRSASASSTAQSGAKGKSRQPLLGDLLMDVLRAHDEPRLAKELRDELLDKHPDRKPTPQVVRNTLEGLVAKGRIRRHKQQRSVMYTLVESADRGHTATEAEGVG
ncbi:BlaI/MecI/CopY family transcriptional regulator [Streptomyces sp. NPDC001792]|uniref:BlaI/MecI/CopY family transcriptional regulator n=1 Tax=Streptomyces sp. NPDC001792 TaxID=3154524 RepID=UPI00331B65DD